MFWLLKFRSMCKWFWSVWSTQQLRSSIFTCNTTRLARRWSYLRSFCGHKHMVAFFPIIEYFELFRHPTIYLFVVKSYNSLWLCENNGKFDENVGVWKICCQNGSFKHTIKYTQFVDHESENKTQWFAARAPTHTKLNIS